MTDVDDAAGFDRLTTFVEREMDFATSHYNDSYLKRRIASRMRRTRSEDYDAYRQLLRSDPDEREALLQALSINVTGFFRNPDVWDGVREALQQLTADHEHVRVWSAACADGREPYSLSMLAHDDPRIDESAVTITGSDINEQSLATAREGVYHSTRTVDIGEQLEYLTNYRRYVDRDGDSFRVTDRIKDPVTFEHHDLINDDPKPGFDMVMCRNLFIYIDGEYKQPVLRTISQSLRSGGYLVIGKAETIPREIKSAFVVLDGRLRIYRRA